MVFKKKQNVVKCVQLFLFFIIISFFMILTYAIVLVLLVAAELVYFRVADKFNIIDKPNNRSSHSKIVLRGGGIIFSVGAIVWAAMLAVMGETEALMMNLPFLAGLLLVAGISFVDDIHPLPDSVRLVVQFVAMFLMFWSLDILHWNMWWVVILALIVCVGITNVYNFMDGINGITGGYSFAVLLPLLLIQGRGFGNESLIITVLLADLVFCFFNFRPKNKAKCFAGDVGSISIAFIILFLLGKVIVGTGDVTWLVFLIVYGVDACFTILHRIMLHENLGQAHRKHAYQLMANELGMSHIVVSSLYMLLQLAISLAFVYLVPDTVAAHWIYLVAVLAVLAAAYLLFMKKYYHLHEEYLKGLK